MKEIVMLLIVCLVPITLFGVAGLLAFHKISGWSWFLFCALLIAGHMKYSYTPDAASTPNPPTEDKYDAHNI